MDSMSSRSWSAVRASASAMPGAELTLQDRQHRTADAGAQEAGVLVVGVRPPLDAVGAAGRLGLRTGEVEQRPTEGHRPLLEVTAHPLQRTASRSPGQSEQHRLRLVVLGVPQQHHVGPEVQGELRQGGVPRQPGTGLDSSRTRIDRDLDRRRLVDAERGHLGHHLRGVLPRPLLQAVVDHGSDDARPDATTLEDAGRQQRQRVGPTGAGHEGNAATVAESRPYGVAHRRAGRVERHRTTRGRGRSRAPGRGSPPSRGGSPGWPRRR